MAKKNMEQIAEEIALPILDELGYELVDVEYKKEGAHWYLRIYIDKPGGVTIDDCQEASDRINTALDEAVTVTYDFLEISSPGLDRPLKKDKDFIRYMGRKVDVKLYKAIKGTKNYTGELVGLVDGNIHVTVDGELMEFKREEVAIIRLAIEF
ncbi:MAG: ribosome maturation factor RimP [Clostridiales bacterium]|nr:ribosome maturation factor RimP [Clostridiales bacterium]